MASNARVIADGGGGGGGGGGGEYAGTRNDSFHALSVNDDGMLKYTKFDMIDKNSTLKISTDAGNSVGKVLPIVLITTIIQQENQIVIRYMINTSLVEGINFILSTMMVILLLDSMRIIHTPSQNK